jgi:hypothetical protein
MINEWDYCKIDLQKLTFREMADLQEANPIKANLKKLATVRLAHSN